LTVFSGQLCSEGRGGKIRGSGRLTSEVPNAGIDHAVSGEGHGCSNNSAGENIIPIVVLVDGQSTANEHGAEDGHVENDEFPHGGVVVGEHLQLCIEIEVKEDESSECGSRVTRRHRLQAVVNLTLVTSANLTIVHDLTVSIANLQSSDVGLANSEEVGTQSTDEPLDEDLEDGGGDESVEQTNSSIVDVPEGTNTDLDDEEYGDGDQSCHEGCCPDGDDLVAHGVGEFGIDDLVVDESHCV
jgi:hypothetical protein